MIKVSVVGAKGRMGSHVVDAVNGAQDMELALTLDAGDDLHAITPENTDVVVEFTVPSVTLDNVLTLIGQGVDVVVGTTGWTEDRLEQVRQALAAAPRADHDLRGAGRLFRQARRPVLRVSRSGGAAPSEQGRRPVRHRHPHGARHRRRTSGRRPGPRSGQYRNRRRLPRPGGRRHPCACGASARPERARGGADGQRRRTADDPRRQLRPRWPYASWPKGRMRA